MSGVLSHDMSAIDTDIQQAVMRVIQQGFKYGFENDIVLGECLVNSQGKYVVSDVQNYELGTILIATDGRIYQYGKSSAACISGQGCEFVATAYILFTAFAVGALVDATSITIPAATHGTLTLNELKGGYVIIYDGTTNNVQFRRILTNAAAAANAAFVVTLDGALNEAVVVATSTVELFTNPWASLRTGTDTNFAKAGVPASKVTGANKYFWVQREGMCWVAPFANLGNAGKEGGFWHDWGNVSDGATTLGVTIPNAHSCQYAGHTITGSLAGPGPLFHLSK